MIRKGPGAYIGIFSMGGGGENRKWICRQHFFLNRFLNFQKVYSQVFQKFFKCFIKSILKVVLYVFQKLYDSFILPANNYVNY